MITFRFNYGVVGEMGFGWDFIGIFHWEYVHCAVSISVKSSMGQCKGLHSHYQKYPIEYGILFLSLTLQRCQ